MSTPLMQIDTQHQDMVHDAQLDYYAKKLATCSSDRLIKVYDIVGDQQYQHVADLAGHDGPVWEVAWAHPKFGTILASCSYDAKVIIHREASPHNWQQIYVFDELKSSVNSISWSPHEYNLNLACASSDGKVVVLSHNPDDTWTATHIEDSPLGVNSVTWAPYGSLGSQVDGVTVKRIATGSCDNCVRVYSLREGENSWSLETTLRMHTDWVRDVAWAPSLGIPCNTLASCSEDGKVLMWTQEKAGGDWTSKCVTSMETPVWRLSWSVTGNVLAVSSGDATVTLWKESLDGKWVQISNVKDAEGVVAGSGGGNAINNPADVISQ